MRARPRAGLTSLSDRLSVERRHFLEPLVLLRALEEVGAFAAVPPHRRPSRDSEGELRPTRSARSRLRTGGVRRRGGALAEARPALARTGSHPRARAQSQRHPGALSTPGGRAQQAAALTDRE